MKFGFSETDLEESHGYHKKFKKKKKNFGAQNLVQNGITHINVKPFYTERENKALESGKKRIINPKNNHESNKLQSVCSNWSWSHCFSNFCKITSLHGFHYLTDRNRALIEKIFWFAAIILAHVLCGILICNSITKWLSKPVIVSIENLPTPVSEIPFPAITICSSNQLKSSVFGINKILNPSEGYLKNISTSLLLDYASMICKTKLNGEFYKEGAIIDQDIVDFMIKNVHTTCKETFKYIQWINVSSDKPCSMMQSMMTIYGLCYSFNMMPLQSLLTDEFYQVVKTYMIKESSWYTKETKWAPDLGYLDKIQQTDVPIRLNGAGMTNAMSLTLQFDEQDFDADCYADTRGFIVLIHNPADVPTTTSLKSAVNLRVLQSDVVNPKLLKTADDVKVWPPEARGCFFDNERQLRYFKLYTQQNCKLECESNRTFLDCGCVLISHPRSLEMSICGPAKFKCVFDVAARMAEKGGNFGDCNCLRGCTMISYDINAFSFDSAWNIKDDVINNLPDDASVDNSSHLSSSTIMVFYQDEDISPLIRVSFHTFGDFVGNAGGIMSLFLGFSWISLLEVLYFLTLRPLVNIWNR